MNLLSLAKERVEAALSEVLDHLPTPEETDGPDGAHKVPARLLEAMRYSVLSPGKRLRPALVLGGAHAVGLGTDAVIPAACAVEMVHAYSLIHDDLPALDDDDLRRGQPTCHRKFDEATAILAGDALLTEALSLLTDPPRGRRKPPRGDASLRAAARSVGAGKAKKSGKAVRAPRARDRVAAVRELARAVGSGGMVGGQYDDVLSADDGHPQADTAHTEQALLSIHHRKTGRLIRASVALGALYGGAKKRDVERLRAFGSDIGLAFQLVDDALDADGIARIRGADVARAQALELTDRGIATLKPLGAKARPLAELARMIVERRA